MNEIEQKFYDAFIEVEGDYDNNIRTQVPIGIYIADFVIYSNGNIPSVVEIDGHDFHKTKEQRFADYKKERYFMSQGYAVIRFMASEVFVDATKCATTAIGLACLFDEKTLDAYEYGIKQGERQMLNKLGLGE